MRMHANYQRVIEKARESHEQNRNPAGIDGEDITIARLYSYAFRLHVIGAFHATRLALAEQPPRSRVAEVLRQRAAETLEDLTNQAMEPVSDDFHDVVTTLYRYHRGVVRVMDSLEAEATESGNDQIAKIASRFRDIVESITSECGIHLTQDTHAPEQASFVVPNLGISIVPLVYGDHHSWNLAWLAGEERNVPTHRHQQGVEIHLGYDPTHGVTVLGDARATVDEGYAMPIPPQTDHGWVNTTESIHHVPFIFGSLQHAGWGVFLDVEARIGPLEERRLVDRESPEFSQMVYLEREIDQAAKMTSSWRKTLIASSVTNRSNSGGLELCLTRANPSGYSYEKDAFRILSVPRGQGLVDIEGITREIGPHDHLGVPAGLKCHVRQTGTDPLIVLDATIRGYGRR